MSISLQQPPHVKPEISYVFQHETHTIYVFGSLLNEDQRNQILLAQAEFALVLRDEFFLILCRFGHLPWMKTAPYQWHFLPKEQQLIPHGWRTSKFEIILIDDSHNPYGSRSILIDPDFMSSLCGAIALQASRPLPSKEWVDRLFLQLSKHHPTADSLLPLSTVRMLRLP